MLSADKEARKKRTFFPEDIVNSNVHVCLLSKVKQKTLHPLRDEEFSPRYHPNSVEGLKVTSCRSSLTTFEPFNFQTLSDRYNGLLRHRLLKFTDEVPFDFGLKPSAQGNRRVRSQWVFPFDTSAGLSPHSPNSLTG